MPAFEQLERRQLLSGTPTQLAFLSAPGNAGPGVGFPVAVVAEDSGGNIATSASGTVTLTLAGGPGALVGTTTAAFSSGVATFSNVALGSVGTDTLKASSGALEPATSTISVQSGIVLSTLANFNKAAGDIPLGSMVEDSSGNLYGTTSSNGFGGGGTIFEWVKSTGTISTLATFSQASANGSDPQDGLILDSAGDLFGTTSELYPASATPLGGTIFEWVRSTGALTTLVTFDGTNQGGQVPNPNLVMDSSGDLFATTQAGGSSTGIDGTGNGTLVEWVKSAGTVSTLVNFNGTTGATPLGGLINDSNGDLFGTTSVGPSIGVGSIFELVNGAHTLNTLAVFNANSTSLGHEPMGTLVADSSGDLFGTTNIGGAFGYGTAFEWVKSTGSLSTLVAFNNTNGASPDAGLVVDTAGDLFGTTDFGGSNNDGTVFEWVKSTGSLSTLVNFNGTSGANPQAALFADSTGDLFGTTAGGGTGNGGTLFELANPVASLSVTTAPPTSVPVGGSFGLTATALYGTGSTLGNFTVASFLGPATVSIASGPSGGTILGNATATAASGVASFAGLSLSTPGTYSLEVSGGGQTTTVSVTATPAKLVFTGTPTYAAPGIGFAVTVAAEDTMGNILSTVNGVVMLSLASGTSPLSSPATATLTGGVATFASIAIGSPGTYTLQASEGPLTSAASSSISIATGLAMNDLVNFNTTSGGNNPEGSLIEDASGNLYGTTSFGGTNTDGTVFEWVKSAGTVSTLVNFNGANGKTPDGNLLLDSSGNLYGTTSSSGGGTDDTVFEWIKSSGSLTTLVSFNGTNGATPQGGLIADSSGDLFGTTEAGGSNSDGTVFEWVKSSGSLSTLVTFNNTNGRNPVSSLVADSSGNLYGTTTAGGTGTGGGTVFEWVKSANTLSTIASFNNGDTYVGYDPPGSLYLDASGDLFGTTEFGATGGGGAIFEWNKGSSALTAVAYFSNTTGTNPEGGLVADASGDLFGTASAGGSSNDGTVFEYVKSLGGFEVLVNFNNTNGAGPAAGVLLDANGTVYGTTSLGGTGTNGLGAGADGTVFEVAPFPERLAIVTAPPTSVTAGGAIALSVAALDGLGNTISGFLGPDVISIASGPSGAMLTGNTTVTAASGLASFSGLSLNKSGTYTLEITGGGQTITTAPINVTPGMLTLTGVTNGTNDDVALTFTGSTTFSVTANGQTTPYSTSDATSFTYNGPGGTTFSEVVFQDQTNPYTVTQSLTGTTLTGASGMQLVLNDVGNLYIYGNSKSTANVDVANSSGSNNFFVDAPGGTGGSAPYSYIGDPGTGAYSELSGMGGLTVTGASGSTYAYIYSTTDATTVAAPGQTTFSVGGQTTTVQDFPEVYVVGSSDGTDKVTLDSSGGTFVAQPGYDYAVGTVNSAPFLLGALYCANVTGQAAGTSDTADFYSYSGDAFQGASGQSTLTGSTTNVAASTVNFSVLAAGYANVAVFESGSDKDTATLTTPGSSSASSFLSTPTANLLTWATGQIVVNTFLLTSSTTPTAATLIINGSSGDSATLDDAPGTNALAISGANATLTTGTGTKIETLGIGSVTAAQESSNDTDTYSESSPTLNLTLNGTWTRTS